MRWLGSGDRILGRGRRRGNLLSREGEHKSAEIEVLSNNGVVVVDEDNDDDRDVDDDDDRVFGILPGPGSARGLRSLSLIGAVAFLMSPRNNERYSEGKDEEESSSVEWRIDAWCWLARQRLWCSRIEDDLQYLSFPIGVTNRSLLYWLGNR